MGDNLVPTGVRLIVENEAAFRKGIDAARQSTGGFSDMLKNLGGQLQSIPSQAGMGMSAFGKLTGVLTGAVNPAMMLAVAGGNLLSESFINLANWVQHTVQQFVAFEKEAIQAASRFEEITTVAYMMGQKQNYTTQQVDEFIKRIRDSGIEAATAAELITEMARASMDMADAEALANVAKDAAVVAGRNSTDTLEGLKYGVMTYNTMILRTYGIMVSADEAFNTYAKTLNKTAGQLTPVEKQQAMLNAVIAEGAKIAGAYDLAMTSGYKIMGSMPRVLNDIQLAIGAPFTGAFDAAMQGVYRFASAFAALLSGDAQKAIEYIGKALGKDLDATQINTVTTAVDNLQQVLGLAGGAAEWFMEQIRDASGSAVMPIIDMLNDAASQFIGFITKAGTWGFNTIAEFALGLIEGALSSIGGAMSLISSMLGGWLSPGSPPKVAPEIDVWGAAAMNEYLNGFTQAQFSILNAIQSPLRAALMTAFGGVGGERGAAETLFADLSEQITEVIATGTGLDELLERIRGAAGDYGDELAELVEQQIALGDATKMLEEYQEILKDANKAQKDAGENVQKLSDEYTALVEAGADPAVLAAKRAELQAAQDAYRLAEDNADAAQEQYDDQVEVVEPLMEQVSLMQQALEEQLEIANARNAAARAAEAEAKAGAAAAAAAQAAADALGGIDMSKLNVTTALDAIKENVKAKLDEMFQPFKDKWNNEIVPMFKPLIREFNTLSMAIQRYYNKRIKPVLDDWKKAFGESIWKSLGKAVGKSIGGILVTIGLLVKGVFEGIMLVMQYIIMLKLAWEVYGAKISDGIKRMVAAWKAIFTVGIPAIVAYVKSKWDEMRQNASAIWELIKTAIAAKVQEIKDRIAAKIQEVKDWLVNKWEEIKTNLSEAWSNMVTAVTTKALEIYTNVTEYIQDIMDWISGIYVDLRDAGIAIIQGILDGLRSIGWKILAYLQSLIPDWVWDLIGGGGANAPSMNSVGRNTGTVEPYASSIAPVLGRSTVINNHNAYNLGVTTQESAPAVIRNFQLMHLVGGSAQ